MSKASMVGGMAAGLALAVSARAIAGPVEIRHVGIGCVTVDRYAQIVAGAAPAESGARAELQFRIRPDADWYGVPMVASGGTWTAAAVRGGGHGADRRPGAAGSLGDAAGPGRVQPLDLPYTFVR